MPESRLRVRNPGSSNKCSGEWSEPSMFLRRPHEEILRQAGVQNTRSAWGERTEWQNARKDTGDIHEIICSDGAEQKNDCDVSGT
jgi:hypothetical protein